MILYTDDGTKYVCMVQDSRPVPHAAANAILDRTPVPSTNPDAGAEVAWAAAGAQLWQDARRRAGPAASAAQLRTAFVNACHAFPNLAARYHENTIEPRDAGRVTVDGVEVAMTAADAGAIVDARATEILHQQRAPDRRAAIYLALAEVDENVRTTYLKG